MTVASLIAGVACVAAAAGYGVRFVLLKPEASAWPKANVVVRAAILVLAGVSIFMGLQLLGGGDCVTGAMAAFMAAHGAYSVILAANLLRQRHLHLIDLPGLFRPRSPTNAAG